MILLLFDTFIIYQQADVGVLLCYDEEAKGRKRRSVTGSGHRIRKISYWDSVKNDLFIAYFIIYCLGDKKEELPCF